VFGFLSGIDRLRFQGHKHHGHSVRLRRPAPAGIGLRRLWFSGNLREMSVSVTSFREAGMGRNRLEAFSDGVLAIIITIMVRMRLYRAPLGSWYDARRRSSDAGLTVFRGVS
jgi:hypothetical protein